MNYSGEAAEQVVRMSLNGVEVAAKISGKAAERLAVLLYAVLREQKKTRGKIRLTNMLKNGKELKVFAVRDNELQKFCEEAKKYGVLYCVLKDNKAEDGLTDIMVRAEDAGKINRIFERFGLATVDMGSVKTEIQQTREEKAQSPRQSSRKRKTPPWPGLRSPVRPSLPPGAEAPEATWASLSGKLPAPPCGRSCGRFAGSRDRSRRRLTGNGYTFPRASRRMRR